MLIEKAICHKSLMKIKIGVKLYEIKGVEEHRIFHEVAHVLFDLTLVQVYKDL